MRSGVGLVVILVALLIVGLLVKKSMSGNSTPVMRAAAMAPVPIHIDPKANVAEQSKQLQAQIKAQVEAEQKPQQQDPNE